MSPAATDGAAPRMGSGPVPARVALRGGTADLAGWLQGGPSATRGNGPGARAGSNETAQPALAGGKSAGAGRRESIGGTHIDGSFDGPERSLCEAGDGAPVGSEVGHDVGWSGHRDPTGGVAQTLRSQLPEGAGSTGLEFALRDRGFGPVAGVDEAGRGACCGPLTAAACILPPTALPELRALTDSKALTPRRREALFDVIREVAVAYAVVHVEPWDIDTYGLQPANLAAMRVAVGALSGGDEGAGAAARRGDGDPEAEVLVRRSPRADAVPPAHLRSGDAPGYVAGSAPGVAPGYVLSDAVRIPGLSMPHLPIVRGDSEIRCISAASILAKVSRDRLMVQLDARYPGYGLARHKGYGTRAHMAAVSLQGGTPQHRYTYANVAAAHQQWLGGATSSATP